MKLYCINFGEVAAKEFVEAPGGYEHAEEPGKGLHIDRAGIDTHYWFTTPEKAAKWHVAKLKAARAVYEETRNAAVDRIEQLDDGIAKLSGYLS